MRCSLVLTLVIALFFTQTLTIKDVRANFFQVCSKKKELSEWVNELKEVENDNYLIIAYKGVASAMYAEIASGVYTKLKYFSTGTKMIERAIAKYPDDVELRFLRLTIQKNAPSFLNYSGNIEADKDKIIKGLVDARRVKSDPFLIMKIVEYLSANKMCTQEELELLKKE